MFTKKLAGYLAAALILTGALIAPRPAAPAAAAAQKRLIPGGMALGVALKTQGVMVVGLSDLASAPSPGRLGGVAPGDVILSVNGEAVSDAPSLSRLIEAGGGKPAALSLLRNGKPLTLTVTPAHEAGAFRLGLWVRDSTAGVGTLSFYDPDTRRYGALGHAITDADTQRILTVSQGEVLKASIAGVRKGQKGAPGELHGSFLRENLRLGDLQKNTPLGVYGLMDSPILNPLYPDGLPVASPHQVRRGKAQILSTLKGDEIRAYDVEILQLFRQAEPAPRSMILKVTDPDLLAITGGIVQGMSGSPIIQDGRIVGAVTHVLVNDPTRGYGIYIEHMLNTAE